MNQSREHSCDGKVKFPSLLAAQIAKKKRKLKYLRAYKCRHCRRWHLGHTAVGKNLEFQEVIDRVAGTGLPRYTNSASRSAGVW